MTESNPGTGDQDKVSDDDWAAAMSEQTEAAPGDEGRPDDKAKAESAQPGAGATKAPAAESSLQAADAHAAGADERVFKPLAAEDETSAPRDLDMIMDIPVTLTVELGQTRLTIRELLDLAKGSIVELDGLAGEPMDILINGYLIAQGEVVVVDEKYGIRITEIVTRTERINKLNR